ncbi:hypothetical protein B0H63DRAFT_559408 [Podospora didyma]|uniref:Uncharacterized protein n=1 Tax=Podospora didyma TaxID=330526 RepID=A0AAE0NUI6_9PEZI|nr:hypothetical protein B0H63DRAFT_559408 [Podospora didyma]
MTTTAGQASWIRTSVRLPWLRNKQEDIVLCIHPDWEPARSPLQIEFTDRRSAVIVTKVPAPQPSHWKILLTYTIHNRTVLDVAKSVLDMREPLAVPHWQPKNNATINELFLPHAHMPDMAAAVKTACDTAIKHYSNTLVQAPRVARLARQCDEWMESYSRIHEWREGFWVALSPTKHVSGLATDLELIMMISPTAMEIAMYTKRHMREWKGASLRAAIAEFDARVKDLRRMEEWRWTRIQMHLLDVAPYLHNARNTSYGG